jgi:hypothetical protein
MIQIDKPRIEEKDNQVNLISHIVNSLSNYENDCYYVADIEYGKYFCDEVADAFVVGMLIPAILSGQNIKINAPMSEKIYYNLCHTVIYALSRAFNLPAIKVMQKELIKANYHPESVGTGCSLGIDSFSTIIEHTADNCPPSYKLTHLTFFNTGAYGEKNSQKAHNSYLNNLKMVKEFANEIKLPLVSIETNLPQFYDKCNIDFNQTGLLRNMSVVLTLQKLFKRYIYSSGYPLYKTQLSKTDLATMETFLLPSLSSESTELVVGQPNLSRTEKAKMICDNNFVQNYLYVCCQDLVVNNDMHCGPWINLNKNKKRNCSHCDKCLRTILTLDILGKLEKFDKVFDYSNKFLIRVLYMAKVIGLKKRNFFFKDVYNLAVQEKFKISFLARLLSVLYKFKIIDLYYSFHKS